MELDRNFITFSPNL
jgi:hypothetical protein